MMHEHSASRSHMLFTGVASASPNAFQCFSSLVKCSRINFDMGSSLFCQGTANVLRSTEHRRGRVPARKGSLAAPPTLPVPRIFPFCCCGVGEGDYMPSLVPYLAGERGRLAGLYHIRHSHPEERPLVTLGVRRGRGETLTANEALLDAHRSSNCSPEEGTERVEAAGYSSSSILLSIRD